jgi:uncharacterized membrane protein
MNKKKLQKALLSCSIGILGFEVGRIFSFSYFADPLHLKLIFYFILSLISVFHVLATLVLLDDLLNVSKRPNKLLWIFLLLVFPLVNIPLYRITMRRNKLSYQSYSYLIFLYR